MNENNFKKLVSKTPSNWKNKFSERVNSYGGIKEVYLIPADIFNREEVTEDADFEIIEPKQLPSPNVEIKKLNHK